MEVTNPAVLRILERRAKEKEEKRAKQKERQKENGKKYYAANRERVLETGRKWYVANKERMLEHGNKWRKNNPERYKENTRRWQKANRDRVNSYRRKSQYGLTTKERDALLVKQGGCACCGTTEVNIKRGWHIDHCHVTNTTRSVLCYNCNLALGHAKENIETLKKMIAYLERYAT